ncbi:MULTISPECIES: patatin-like phospholipase family protein [Alphaproteobacteria]|uniref:Patatin n=2 Tax=Alphaproteobacteria TaxID=28211 RepID=A0A512HHV2_9HYPH|nr:MULTISPECIES: patatin-like phospholipase family protein [Alphaproteobacteria]GEO84970.1 patatin [Ciceribacter naphthalenivorans]GLR22904.1 patatin [Ciceribacter naphthalenivorans]GLT05760.1 patatin [Sphingomonas psychrolutea]
MPETFSFNAIGFAGGGNRCYWQSGFFEALNARLPQSPSYYVTVSAGAYHCAMILAGVGSRVRSAAFSFAKRNVPDINWSALRQGRSPLVVGNLFREFLTQQFGEEELRAIKAAPPMLIQLSTPPRWMPGGLAALGSIAAYQIEKRLTDGAHSKAGRYLGLTPAWVSTHDLATPAELVDALMATSSVPPFMPIGRISGRAQLDGGLVDNPPTLKLTETETAGGKTLLLTTRHGRLPPASAGRTVVGPSEDITVNKFAISDEAGLRHAFETGLRDGEVFAGRLPFLLSSARQRPLNMASCAAQDGKRRF